MTWEYRGLQGVTGGDKGLQGVTRGCMQYNCELVVLNSIIKLGRNYAMK